MYRGSDKIPQLHCKRNWWREEHRLSRLPTLPKATRLDQATLKVYSHNYLLRCSDRQQELCTSRISFQRSRDSRSAFPPWPTLGFYSINLYFTMNSLEHPGIMCDMFTAKRYICKKNPCWTTFSFTIFITFTSPKPSQVKYYCWPPIFAPIEFRISSQY